MLTLEKFKLPAKISVMPDNSRVWVYKADRVLEPEEVGTIRYKGEDFAHNWMVHGETLAAAVEILLDRFVVIVADEKVNKASGCSIDNSVGFIIGLEKELGVKLTDRMIVWYEEDGEIKKCRTAPFKEKICDGQVTADTIVYNDLVYNKGDLETKFRVPARDSWLSSLL